MKNSKFLKQNRQNQAFNELIRYNPSIYHRRVFLKPDNKKAKWTKQLDFEQNSEKNKNQNITDFQTKLRNMSTSQWFSIFMAVITIFTIFSMDIDKAFFNLESSVYFSSVHCLAILLFVFEIFLLSYTKEDYLFRFYFWIDCFSTLTMVLQLIWIQNLMSTSSDVTVAISFAKVTKASRLSKIGARSSKIMKLIRLVRLLKFFQKDQSALPNLPDQSKSPNPQNQSKLLNPTDQKQSNSNEQKQHHPNDNKQSHSNDNKQSHSNDNKQSHSNDNKYTHSNDNKYTHSNYQKQSHSNDNKYTNSNDQKQSHSNDQKQGNLNELNFPNQDQQNQHDYIYKNRLFQLQNDLNKRQQQSRKNEKTSIFKVQANDLQQQQDHDKNTICNNLSECFNLNQNYSSINHRQTQKQFLNIDSVQKQSNNKMFKATQQSINKRNQHMADQIQDIQELMKIFFAKNMNRFVQEGKHITNKYIQNKQSYNQNFNQHKNDYENNYRRNKNNDKNKDKNKDKNNYKNNDKSNDKKYDKNNDKNWVSKRRQSMQIKSSSLQKGRMNINSSSRPGNQRCEYAAQQQMPFCNIIQKFQKNLYLAPLERANINLQKHQLIQQRYKQLLANNKKNQTRKVLNNQNLKVGEVLKEEIQKNIVVLVMGLIMITPIISADTWFDANSSLSTTANLFINDYQQMNTLGNQYLRELLDSFIQVGQDMSTPLIYFYLPVNQTCCEYPTDFPEYPITQQVTLSQLRLSQQTIIIDGNLTIIFSQKTSTQYTAYLNLSRSLFITILLIFCSVLFMKDIQNFALIPLSKMSSLINKISNNPFQALKQIKQQKGSQESSEQIQNDGSSQGIELYGLGKNKQKQKEEMQLETHILTDAIIKITTLLTIGAGEIGSQIISKNIQDLTHQMHSDNIDSQQENTIGDTQTAVYAYLQFRHFQAICDAFGDQIFRYVNKVTQIVHTNAIAFGGMPIEYDGKGFLLLWKPPAKINIGVISSQVSLEDEDNKCLSKMCLLAIESITKMILQLNMLDQTRQVYQLLLQKSSQPQQTNSKKSQHSAIFKQNYQPHMFSSSIHMGQSFYGSFGSNFKLQCKCIGYDVSLTRYLAWLLEKEQYGLSNVISEDVIRLIQHNDQAVARKIKIRKIDQLRIREIRFNDKLNYPYLTYSNYQTHTLRNINNQKNTYLQIYTSDFIAGLQPFNNQEQDAKNNQNNQRTLNPRLNLRQIQHKTQKDISQNFIKKKTFSDHQHIYLDKEKSSNQSIIDETNENEDDVLAQQTLKAYKMRQSYQKAVQELSLMQLYEKVLSQSPILEYCRQPFQQQFYLNWSQALQCYLSFQLSQSLNEFKFLHTQNIQFYDYPSKLFMNRIDSTNVQEYFHSFGPNSDEDDDIDNQNDRNYNHTQIVKTIRSKNRKLTNSLFYKKSNQINQIYTLDKDHIQKMRKQYKKKAWDGVKEVIWKL